MAINVGLDASGNGNNWITNNINTTTVGATYDSMTDVPTLTSATASNFAVFNPLIRSYASQSWALSNGNLQYTDTGSGGGWGLATISATSGKWYWEGTVTANAKNHGIGWTTIGNISFGYNGCYTTNGGVNNTTGGSATTFATYTTNDVIGVAVDVAAGKVWFSKNGTFLGSGDPVAGTNPAFTFTGGTESAPTFCLDNSAGTSGSACNFGQRPFAYTPPTGFVALNTFNLPTPTIGATASTQANKYFDVLLYTGNSSSNRALTGLNFQPDFMWSKSRSNGYGNKLYDSVRGVTKQIVSNDTAAESTTGTENLVSFDSGGVTIGNDTGINGSGATFVDWFWKANGTGVSNTAGSITSTVSANTSAGFSIVTYTGTGSNATIGHGLGVAPKFIIVKDRDRVTDWSCLAMAANNGAGYLGWIRLNTTNAWSTTSILWNNTAPTSSVFSIGTYDYVNQPSSRYVAYCFSAVAGYSAFGSYVGNGSTDGTFIHVGFKPRFIMTKRTDSTSNWTIQDTARSPSNVVDAALFANLSLADNTGPWFDIVSNGFKVRSNGSDTNTNGGTYVYAAFAEHPFKYALGR